MKIPTVHSCCNGCSLKFGVKVIGVFAAIGCILTFGMNVFILIKSKNDLLPYDPFGDFETDIDVNKNIIQAVSGIVFSIWQFIVSILLLVGTFKNKSELIVPYLLTTAVGIVFLFTCIIFTIVKGFPMQTELILFVLFVTILECIFIYMWIVVYSHYVVLKEENARGQYDKQQYRTA